jgi:hypothetical protein
MRERERDIGLNLPSVRGTCGSIASQIFFSRPTRYAKIFATGPLRSAHAACSVIAASGARGSASSHG